MWETLIAAWPWMVFAAGVVVTVTCSLHAVLRKRDTRAVIAWVGLIALAPFVGALAYVWLGVNRIQRKGLALGLREAWQRRPPEALTDEDLEFVDQVTLHYPSMLSLATLGQRLTDQPLLPGNRVTPLRNGDEAYPAMLESIEGAHRSVALLSYIFDFDRVGQSFLDALARAKQRGVQIRVLVDDVGSRYSRPNMVTRLHRAGLMAARFLPTRVPRLFKYANLRNHRKILVVDGEVGFTGGTNIREGHSLQLRPKYPVQCLHFCLQGPVVGQLQEAFAIDWAFATGESLSGEEWFPPIAHRGHVWARGIPHGPDEDFERMPLAIMGAVAAARRTIHVVTPYFLPDATIVQTLNVAAMRGVEVNIVLPRNNNIRLVQWATAAQLWQLLEKGCRVFLSPPPFDHTKLLLIDRFWTLLGSTNWDPRSLRLNFEFNVECYSQELASGLTDHVDEKIARSHEVTLAEVDGRSLPVQVRDGIARLFSPYL